MRVHDQKDPGSSCFPSPLRSLRLRACWVLASAALLTGLHARGEDFVAPTPEELAMKSVPGYPGAPAVVLFREEITDDSRRSIQHHERIKVLTEEGKRYANVELQFASRTGFEGDSLNVESIVGRTVEPDGRVVPFTGKPYLKVLEKGDGIKFQEKVFTLPEVEVGSIIEYRYATRYDNFYESPTWIIQGDLFLKRAHYVWYPTSKPLVDGDGKLITAISWFPILPEGAKIEHQELPGSGINGSSQMYELKVKDVPPKVEEEYMPPIQSYSYRVMFNFTPYNTSQEYWTNTGKSWSKNLNKFSSPDRALKEATATITEGAPTPEEKLKKIYAAVMALENTQFTRSRDRREDKAAGMGEVRAAGDVLTHERGTSKELCELFLAMARSAGFQAYGMLVPDRSQELFTPMWQSYRQFDDLLAIVKVDGKEMFFDPGSRYAPYGQLAWEHTLIQGLRQTDGGTGFEVTPAPALRVNRTTRVANLTMGADGEITGKIDLTYLGSAALHWRQLALRGDEESVRHELRTSLEESIPRTLAVEVSEVKGLKDYEQPLVVTYKVKGSMGSFTGKRLLLPSDLFQAEQKATFPHEKREQAVDFHYARVMQDAVRINFPSSYTVEAMPNGGKLQMADAGSYNMTISGNTTSVTTRRDFVFGAVVVLPKEYGNLRTFYSQVEAKDGESIVLKSAGTGAVTGTN